MKLRAHHALIPVFLLGLLLLYVRMPERLTDGFLWAEDGPIFIKDATEKGITSLWIPYAGYLHLLPRLIAFIQVHLVGLSAIGIWLPWLSAIVTATTCAAIFHIASKHTPDKWFWTGLFAFAPILVPHSGEVFLSLTNLQWILAPLLFLLLTDSTTGAIYQGTPSTILRCTAIFVLALTGPFILFFLPCTIGLMLYKRARDTRLSISVLATSVVATTFQILAYITASTPGPKPIKQELIAPFLNSFITPAFLTDSMQGALYPFTSIAAVGILSFALLCAITARSARILITLMWLIACGLWLLGTFRMHDPTNPITPYGDGSRYTFIPLVMIFWGLVMAAANVPRRLLALPMLLIAMMLFTSAKRLKADVWNSPLIIQNEGHVRIDLAPPGWHIEILDKH